MAINSFDRIAWMYDGLAQLVFFGAIRKSQLTFLSYIEPRSKILIVGGGTGWILSELDKLGILMVVHYVEASTAMLKKSRLREPFKNIQVTFNHGTVEELSKVRYNVIITNFFLDVFSEDNLGTVIEKLDSHLNRDGIWIITDFVNSGKKWQKILIKLMYGFFRFTANIEGSRLLDFKANFEQLGYQLSTERSYFHKMIVSRICMKGKTDQQ